MSLEGLDFDVEEIDSLRTVPVGYYTPIYVDIQSWTHSIVIGLFETDTQSNIARESRQQPESPLISTLDDMK